MQAIDGLIPKEIKQKKSDHYKGRLLIIFLGFELISFLTVGDQAFSTEGFMFYLMLLARILVFGVFLIKKDFALPVNLIVAIFTFSIFYGIIIQDQLKLSYFLLSLISAFFIQILLGKSRWVLFWIGIYIVLWMVEADEHGIILESLSFRGGMPGIMFFITLVNIGFLVIGQHYLFVAAKQELDDLLREKEYMTSVVSHDLKSPLNRVLGFGSLLKLSGKFSKKQNDVIDTCSVELENGKQYVDYIMTEAMETPSAVEINELDLDAVCQQAVRNQRQLTESLDVSIEVRSQCKEPIKVHSSQEHMDRMLYRCFEYMVLRTDKGGKVTAELSQEDSLIKVQITTDNAKKDAVCSQSENNLAIAEIIGRKIKGRIKHRETTDNKSIITITLIKKPWNNLGLTKEKKINPKNLVRRLERFFIPAKFKGSLTHYLKALLFIRFMNFFLILTFLHRLSSALLDSDHLYLPWTGYLIFVIASYMVLYLLKYSGNLNLAANIVIAFLNITVIWNIYDTFSFRLLDFVNLIISFSLMVTFSSKLWRWIWSIVLPASFSIVLIYLSIVNLDELYIQPLNNNSMIRYLLFGFLAFMLIWGKDRIYNFILQREKELEQLKTSYFSVTANGLKRVISNVQKGLVSISNEGGLNDEQESMIEMSEAQLAKCKNLIDDIVSANGNERKDELDYQSINVAKLINQVVDSFDEEASRKQITIHRQNLSSKTVETNEISIQRILDNLISNAIKFSSHGEQIWVRLVESKANFSIQVEDQGPGISEADQAKMFKLFQKLTATPTGGESSHGVGLSCAKNLVEQMNGRISIKTELRKGTCFTVTLPKRRSPVIASSLEDDIARAELIATVA